MNELSSTNSAEEHLKAIRSLMERATIYRSLSGPAALAGGISALATCGYQLWMPREAALTEKTAFLSLWLIVLAVLALFNTWLLRREALRRQEPFGSGRIRHALVSLTPPLVAGFVLSLTVANSLPDTVLCWMFGYGLALLATGSFAPRSMRLLGLAFFLCGIGLAFLTNHQQGDARLAYQMMAGGFGVLHLAYGIWVLVIRKKSGADTL
jgi:preprotein translocase subunit SecG